MTTPAVQNWLERLGYAAETAVLHRKGEQVPETHPYALEIKTLLKEDGAIRAHAVFDVAGVPTVVFVGNDGQSLSSKALENPKANLEPESRYRCHRDQGEKAVALPARKLKRAEQLLSLSEARIDGPFSALEVASANLPRRMPKWFDIKARVDRKLLGNLATAVEQLADSGLNDQFDKRKRRRLAELLMGQVLFISYLEHRDIVGQTYRAKRKVETLAELVSAGKA